MSRTMLPVVEGGAARGATRRDVTARFRAKLTANVTRLMRRSEGVARQFMPSVEELEEYGGTETPFEEGKDNRGIYGLERIYEDRAVLTPYFDCSAYCRYCFKKTRTLAGDGRAMTPEDVDRAIAYIAADPRIRIVLVTGGDPLVRPELLRAVLDRAAAIPHVRQLRIGTRNLLFRPELLDDAMADWLASSQRLDPADLAASRSLALAVSINHPDELYPAYVRALRRLLERGVVVRAQVTLLKGVNDDAATLRRLYESFAAVGLTPYYLYHCMPVVGARHFRTSVQRGLDLLEELAPLTGALAPHYVYVTPVGKHRLGRGAQLEHVERAGRRWIRATTPYRAVDFLAFSDSEALPPMHEVDAAGRIVSHYPDGEDG